MEDISNETIRSLSDRFDIPVEPSELAQLRERVQTRVSAATRIEDYPLDRPETRSADRSWSAADDSDQDACNAIVTYCDVAPTSNDGPLAGVTVGVKDNIAVAGVPMTCASEMLDGYVPEDDARVVTRLRASGARITAKTNCDEFGSVGNGENGFGGPIRNPHDPDRVAGGSSGGSAVAVATGQVDAALGTDTGGSIRKPAAYCDVVGLKPSWGLVPLTGFVENSFTLDCIGPFGRTVDDVARILPRIAGPTPADPASLRAAGLDAYEVPAGDANRRTAPDPSELAFGLVEESLDGGGTEASVADRTVDATERLADAGAEVTTVSLPTAYEIGRSVYTVLYCDTALSWRAGGIPYRRGGYVDPSYPAEHRRRSASSGARLNPKLRAKLLAGAYLAETDRDGLYGRARAARRAMRAELDRALADVDAIVSPTAPTVAPRIGESTDGVDQLRNTRVANITHAPAISLPTTSAGDLPVGIQLVAPRYRDDRLLAIASAIEAVI